MLTIWAYRDERTGFGQVAQALARELSLDEDIATVEWGSRRVFSRWSGGARREADEAFETLPRCAALGVGSPAQLPEMVGTLRVGIALWEGTRFPRPVRRGLASLDALWAPSAWGEGVVERAGIEPQRIRVVPHGVDTERFRPPDASEAPPEGRFRFLSVGKWERRKGHDVLLRCFERAFGGSRDVELVLHCGADVWHDVARAGARRILGRTPPNVVFSPERPFSEMPDLYREARCFVLTTRAEAWGLPVSEAMACGVPPIVTDYSGPTAFVHQAVGYPVRVLRMRTLRDRFFYTRPWHGLPVHGKWAEPDPDHVCARLREAVEDPDGLRRRGLAARREMIERWTWRDAGRRARQCLAEHRAAASLAPDG